MAEVIPVKLTVAQIRILHCLALSACREAQDRANSSSKQSSKDRTMVEAQRLSEIAEILDKIAPMR